MGESLQAQYLDVITSDDEVCISWIMAYEASGDKKPYTWLGDVGAACGQAWQYGLYTINGGNSQLYAPRCTWLDADHGEDIDKNPVAITNRQMKINMWAYADQGGRIMDLDYYCGSTIFSHDMDDPIPGRTPRGPQEIDGQLVVDTGAPNVPRSTSSQNGTVGPIRKRSPKSASELVVNSRPYQSAVKLCNSPTSRGSDFVSVDEGLFCVTWRPRRCIHFAVWIGRLGALILKPISCS
ncbi:uncharacterized protein RCC_04409 [Ramularia collo-cygni]|uniref:Uncharacterized protein n=1 Tax=Ramularia collo-cygni TaxID=112498 RepID=A0A2D3UWD4_9PEZI|nr:uncharacterized protein RCC_04409 [Ramularia collo-cygni]CZT18565.1 uncharacterized protein RCC_04409 [Ramularia collo-cygni]